MAGIRPVERELTGGCAFGASSWYHSMLTSDWSWAGGPGGLFSLFQEMEDKDAHLFSTLQTRKNALLACPYKVIAGDDSPEAREAARLVEANLSRIANLHTGLFHLLDALGKGFAVAEVMWQVEPATGEVQASDIHARNQADFAFDANGKIYLLAESAGTLSTRDTAGDTGAATISQKLRLLPRPGESMVVHRRAQPMPARKFLHFAFQGNVCSPYGAALCIKAYWYYWLKKNTLNHWALFNEKFGSPTAVARYSSTTTEEDLSKLEEAIGNLPRDNGVLLPEGVALEFLEARRSSGVNTYREMADWCNDEISKVVLGQTLTTSEGRRTGSLALGRVHEAVRHDYVASDAAALGQVLTSQLARWLTDFNFGTHVPSPRVVFDVAPAEEFEAELRVDRELVKMGVPLSTSYFYERYRRQVPQEGERVLRYDDANLYQYHLLHGVLTINEVRATLGLPDVAWGDAPTGRGVESRHSGGRDADPDEAEGEAEADEASADRRT